MTELAERLYQRLQQVTNEAVAASEGQMRVHDVIVASINLAALAIAGAENREANTDEACRQLRAAVEHYVQYQWSL
jgi:hypothetical protein